ncbi:hypothetical protein Bbelb_351270 [Branchiostoma belcheri]|nr:hypothetical protein Bbelb_351270 [Branchiostoma belcheri]
MELHVAETTLRGVRQQRANYQQWRAVRARQDEEFQATGPSSCRAVEMDEYSDSDMSEEDSHSQNAILLTRAAWQNLGLQQLDTALETEDDLVLSFPQHGRHNSMGDTSPASTVPLIQEDPE